MFIPIWIFVLLCVLSSPVIFIGLLLIIYLVTSIVAFIVDEMKQENNKDE